MLRLITVLVTSTLIPLVACGLKATVVMLKDGSPSAGSAGWLELEDIGGQIHIYGQIHGLSPGKHGIHVHTFGDLSGGCVSTGTHFSKCFFRFVILVVNPRFKILGINPTEGHSRRNDTRAIWEISRLVQMAWPRSISTIMLFPFLEKAACSPKYPRFCTRSVATNPFTVAPSLSMPLKTTLGLVVPLTRSPPAALVAASLAESSVGVGNSTSP
ncbi:unnamed protein product [Rhizoctonia solani]|uniref:Superoxide dismutase copper/zinc binding domain-containing protein n=1 Tax=Rhizoctonia solani TaxID=456999 RepID=A0A8H3HXJ4_9AGAM|nr:unnamed protein product [Rhizoctonia solani]